MYFCYDKKYENLWDVKPRQQNVYLAMFNETENNYYEPNR